MPFADKATGAGAHQKLRRAVDNTGRDKPGLGRAETQQIVMRFGDNLFSDQRVANTGQRATECVIRNR